MNFDEWDAHCEQCVTYCDAGVGKSSRIDDDEVDGFVTRGMNAFDQLMLGVALQAEQMMPLLAGQFAQVLVDLIQCRRAVDAGFTAAEAVQVGSVEDQDAGHCACIPLQDGCAAAVTRQSRFFRQFAVIRSACPEVDC